MSVGAVILTATIIASLRPTCAGVSFEMVSHETFPYPVYMGEISKLSFNYTVNSTAQNGNKTSNTLHVWVSNSNLVRLITPQKVVLGSGSGQVAVQFEGLLPGRTTLRFDPVGSGAQRGKVEGQGFELAIERQDGVLDIMFTVVVILIVAVSNIGLGCTIDLNIVKDELRRPLAPGIGLFSQFMFMPLIAFAVVSLMNLELGIALGLFSLGCAPGGSASNVFTFLLGGNVSLSITMTLISTIAALGLIPLWLFTLGAEIMREAQIRIPFFIILTSLLGLVIPVLIGIVFQHKFPRLAKVMVKAIKYLTGVFLLFVFTAGVYINLYIFSLMTPVVLLSSALLPYLGFFLGGTLAAACRQEWTNVLTIAVETGIQNTGVPIMLLRLSLSGPERDTGIVAPIASSIFTPIPLACALLVLQARKWLKRRQQLRKYREQSANGTEQERSLKEPGIGRKGDDSTHLNILVDETSDESVPVDENLGYRVATKM